MRNLSKFLTFSFSIYCSVITLITYVYFTSFLANEDLFSTGMIKKTIDSEEGGFTSTTFLINLALITLFGLQHSLMAREKFKNFWKRYVPEYFERNTYMLMTSIALMILIWLWNPVSTVIWYVDNASIESTLDWIYLSGFGITVLSVFSLDFFEFIGLKQAYCYLKNEDYTPPSFKVKGLYRIVRSPIMIGLLLMLWSTPAMTLGHLLFSTGMTIYIFIGMYFEDKLMLKLYGDEYREYKKYVRSFWPIPKKKEIQVEIKEIKYNHTTDG